MSRISDYTAVALPGAGQVLRPVSVVDLVTPTGALLASTDPAKARNGVSLWKVGGAVLQLDPDRTLSRSMTVTVMSEELDLVPSEPGSPLHPETGARVRVHAGLADGPMWTLATLLIDAVQAEDEGGTLTLVVLDLVDPGRPLRSDLVDPVPWAADEPVEAVVSRLLAVVLGQAVDEVDLAETGYGMPSPGAYPPGGNVAALVQELLGSVGHELTADEDGRLYSRPVPATTDDGSERWLYGGPGRLPVARANRRWAIRTPQGVLVRGGGLLTPGATLTVPVWDTDPGSQGFYRGPGEVQLAEVTYHNLTGPSQAVVAGYGRLRRIGDGPAIVEIEVAPNPALRPGDVVDLHLPTLKASGVYRVRSVNGLPTQPDQLQSVTLRAVWDPALGYGDPADPGLVCVSSVSDSFDRADQNLEDLEGQPGSPLWTEHRFSWAVVGGVAIQRHNGTVSLARYNVPMCGVDYAVTMGIADVPAGKWIGPGGRSSGQFDGYMAVVDSGGRIRVEMWQAGQKLAELGAYSTGQDPSGRTLSLVCDGDEIVAVWEGVEVLGIVDTRRTGPFVGMHAIGGVQGSTAPGAQYLTAELL